MIKSKPTGPTCLDCNDEGWYDVDMGGGATRKQFCDCKTGQELRRQMENARQTSIDLRVDEYMERKKFKDW